jgi:hypothetical protein
MHRLQYPDAFDQFSMKASPSGILLGVLLGILLALIAASWKALSARPRPGASHSLAGAPASVPDPLWMKAVAIAGRNDRWVARRFSEDQRVYDADGELKESTVSTFSVAGGTRKNLEVSVLTSVKNGADNRSAKAAELAKSREREERKAGGGNKKEAENPFAPDNQSRVEVRPLGPEKSTTIAGRGFRAFAFTQRTDEGIWDGVAWLDDRTGIPGRLVSAARVATLPKTEDEDFHLRSLRVIVHFQTEDADRWRAQSVRLELEITYRVAPLLTFEGRVRNTYRFSQYERLAGKYK